MTQRQKNDLSIGGTVNLLIHKSFKHRSQPLKWWYLFSRTMVGYCWLTTLKRVQQEQEATTHLSLKRWSRHSSPNSGKSCQEEEIFNYWWWHVCFRILSSWFKEDGAAKYEVCFWTQVGVWWIKYLCLVFITKPKTYQHPLISSLLMFVVDNQENFQTNLSVHGLGTRNKNQFYAPTSNLSCF